MTSSEEYISDESGDDEADCDLPEPPPEGLIVGVEVIMGVDPVVGVVVGNWVNCVVFCKIRDSADWFSLSIPGSARANNDVMHRIKSKNPR
jgi:hypothetical protein